MAYRSDDLAHFKTFEAQRVPRVMRSVGWIIVIAMVAVTAFVIFTPWVQTTSGYGSVTALNPNDRLQEINALVPGRIQE
jgi:multidrug efflux pump subunit AcrA (membrane-fusion protein)